MPRTFIVTRTTKVRIPDEFFTDDGKLAYTADPKKVGGAEALKTPVTVEEAFRNRYSSIHIAGSVAEHVSSTLTVKEVKR